MRRWSTVNWIRVRALNGVGMRVLDRVGAMGNIPALYRRMRVSRERRGANAWIGMRMVWKIGRIGGRIGMVSVWNGNAARSGR